MRDSYALYVDQLQGEYKDVFQQVETYVSTQNVDEDTVEAHMGELLDLFLNAQQEGKSVNRIVGDDMESFCKNFCSEFTWENKAMNIVERWKNVAWIILVLEGLDVVFLLIGGITAGDNLVELLMTESTFNLTGYVMGFVVVWFIYTIMDYITQKVMFKLKKGSVAKRIWDIVKVIVVIGCFFIIFAMMENESLRLLALPSWVLAGAAGVFLVVYYVINSKRIKERKAHKISFWGMVQEEVNSDFPGEFQKEMQKMFEKKNKKLLKKGKPEMTWKEFVDDREREIRKGLKWKVLYDWGPVIITIPLGVIEYLNSGFGPDLIVYIVILFVCEFLCLKGVWKLLYSGFKTNIAWVDMERRRMERTGE